MVFGLAACGGGGERAAVVDTLPGGIERVLSAAPAESGWALVETGRLGGDADPEALSDPRSIALDGEGRLYLADGNPITIRVFTRDGKLVRSIGREGAGPGEYRVAFLAVHGATLVVHDPAQNRTSTFDTSGTFRKSWVSACCAWWPVHTDRAGQVYVPLMAMGPRRDVAMRYLRFTQDGALVDTLEVPAAKPPAEWVIKDPSGKMMMSTVVPNSPQERWTILPEGGLLHGWSGGYALATSRTGRDTLRLFGRDWSAEPVPAGWTDSVTEARIREIAEYQGEGPTRAAFRAADVPGSRPAYDWLFADSAGRRWVLVNGAAGSTFEVFDSAGRFLARVALPFPLPPPPKVAFGDDELAVAGETGEGIPYVARLRLTRP